MHGVGLHAAEGEDDRARPIVSQFVAAEGIAQGRIDGAKLAQFQSFLWNGLAWSFMQKNVKMIGQDWARSTVQNTAIRLLRMRGREIAGLLGCTALGLDRPKL